MPHTRILFKVLGKLRSDPPVKPQNDRKIIFTQASRLSKRRPGPSLRDIVSRAAYSSRDHYTPAVSRKVNSRNTKKKDSYENPKPGTSSLSPARPTQGEASISNVLSTRIVEVDRFDQNSDSDGDGGGPPLNKAWGKSSESSGRLSMKGIDIMPGDSEDMMIETIDTASFLEEENVPHRLGDKEEAVEESLNLLQQSDDLFISQSTDTTNWKFVITNLTGSARSLVTRWVNTLECKGMSCEIDEEVTHVITRTGTDMEAQRTLKYLQAVASGKLVVSHLWVERAAKLGYIPPVLEFEVKDEENGGTNGPWRSRVDRENRKPGILNRFEVFVSEELVGLSKEAMEDLLVRAGARCVTDENAFSYRHDINMVIIADSIASMETKVVTRRLRKHELATVEKNWLLDSLGDWSLQPLLPYMITQVTIEDLVTAGYSVQLTNTEI